MLTPHGHVVVLGFKPGGLWGLRRLVPDAGMPPGAGRLISVGRLGEPGAPILAGACRLLYAHGPEKGDDTDPHEATVALAIQSRWRHRRTIQTRIPNPF